MTTYNKNKELLNIALRGQFEVAEYDRVLPLIAIYGEMYGEVNFGTLTAAQAERLIRLGFPYLRPLSSKQDKAGDEGSKTLKERAIEQSETK